MFASVVANRNRLKKGPQKKLSRSQALSIVSLQVRPFRPAGCKRQARTHMCRRRHDATILLKVALALVK